MRHIHTIDACTGNLLWGYSRGFLFFACLWFVPCCLAASCEPCCGHSYFLWKKFYELAFRICPDTAVCAPFYSAAHRSVSQCRAASGQYSSVVSFFQKFLSAYWRIQKSVHLQDSGLYPQKWWQKIPYSIRNLSCILDALAEIHSGFFRVPFFSVPLLLLSAFFAMFFILYMEVFYHVSKYLMSWKFSIKKITLSYGFMVSLSCNT